MFDKKKSGWILMAFLFILIGVVFCIIHPDSIGQIVNVDLKQYTFSGSAPPLLIVIGVVFAWLGLRETKSDMVQKAVDTLRNATDNIEGKIITLRFCLTRSDEMMSEFRKLYGNRTLRGKYTIKRGHFEVKSDDLHFFEDAVSKTIMAEISDVPLDTLVEIELSDNGRKIWRASESARVRVINMDLEKRD